MNTVDSSFNRFSFQGCNNRSIQLSLKQHDLHFSHCIDKDIVDKIIPVENIKLNTWYWIAMNYTKRSMRRSSVSIFFNEKCVFEERISYPDSFDGGKKSSYQVCFGKQMDQSQKPLSGQEYTMIFILII